MTSRRHPNLTSSASHGRRGRGAGEPAAHPVPPRDWLDYSEPSVIPDSGPWLLESRDVARLLGIGRTKTFQLMASGELPTLRLGRCVRVPAAALQEWISRSTSFPTGGQ